MQNKGEKGNQSIIFIYFQNWSGYRTNVSVFQEKGLQEGKTLILKLQTKRQKKFKYE